MADNKKKNVVEEAVEEAKAKKAAEESAEETTDKVVEESANESAQDTESVEEASATEEATQEAPENNKYQQKIDELNDKCLRQMAEFENYRNRTEKEKQAMFETGAKSVIEKVLPVVDNFERGIAALSEEEKESNFGKGMLGIYKQLIDELDKLQVKPIEAVGKEFDPNLHNAVMQTESEEYESGIVAQELQKGYTYRDQVVRHSMVAVVQ